MRRYTEMSVSHHHQARSSFTCVSGGCKHVLLETKMGRSVVHVDEKLKTRWRCLIAYSVQYNDALSRMSGVKWLTSQEKSDHRS